MKRKQFILIQVLFWTLFSMDTGVSFAEEAQEFLCVDLKGVPLCGATSYLQEGEEWGKYHTINLFDKNKNTAWVEGAEGDGIGERVWFEIEPGIQELVIVNGYAKNQNLYLRNNRVKKIDLQVWVGIQEPGTLTEIGPLFKAMPASTVESVEIEDKPEPQSVPIELDWKTVSQKMESAFPSAGAVDRSSYFLVFTIREVFRGTHYRDTCIAEISWKLNPEESGPGGIGKLDIRGNWTVEKGSPWERIQIEWIPPDYQKWSSFLYDKLFDAGTWEMGNGVLKLWTDSKSGEEFVFTQAQIREGLLYLQEEDGSMHVWRKE